MAVAAIDRVQIFTHGSQKHDVLAALQESGLVHLDSPTFEDLPTAPSPEGTDKIEHTLYRLRHALDILSEFDETGGLKRMIAGKPRLGKDARGRALAGDYLSVLDGLERREEKKHEIEIRRHALEKDIEFLNPLRPLRIPICRIRPTDSTQVRLAAMPVSRKSDLESLAAEIPLWFEIVSADKRSCRVLLIHLREDAEAIEPRFKDIELDFLSIEPFMDRSAPDDTVETLLEKIRVEISEGEKAVAALNEEIKALAVHRPELMAVHDVLLSEKQKSEALGFFGETDRACVIEGWIKTDDRKKLQASLDAATDAHQVFFRQPLPDEESPVDLQNSEAAKPFEIITRLYGLPEKGYLDPTVSMAPFFFLYVGLTVGEAGYGLLITILSLLFMKFAKPKGGALQFARLFLFLGVANIVCGTFFGGWFGFPIRKLLLIDAIQDPIPFMILALALGFIQVWFGTALGLLHAFKTGHVLEAVFVKGGWLLLLPALTLYLALGHSVFGILSLVAAASIVLFASPSRNPFARVFGGLFKLYGISGYLSDILSYSRILALGLSTSVVAMVVNTLVEMAAAIPVIGWFAGALVFIGGHLFNLAIGFLGGFVHSMRLQFVEFFTKFYQAGGKAFAPLRLENRYVEFEE
ncbi:MAG: V-type ATP synthase subunit I [Acidobacteriota bacterium]|nr:V-type ATP synthase subunit I [Acidobacteriota bacterium]